MRVTWTGARASVRTANKPAKPPPTITTRLTGWFIVVLPHSLVRSARVAELIMAALFGHPAAIEHHDVVDLVEPVALVRDEQDGTALGGVQQVRGERPAGGRVQVGGGLVEDQQ